MCLVFLFIVSIVEGIYKTDGILWEHIILIFHIICFLYCDLGIRISFLVYMSCVNSSPGFVDLRFSPVLVVDVASLLSDQV